MFLFICCVLLFDPEFTKEAGMKDPIGKQSQLKIYGSEYAKIKAEQIANGSNYNDNHINITVSNDIKADLNSPIIPTQEERMIMKNNVPVIMPYLVRPEQMLLLMKHD